MDSTKWRPGVSPDSNINFVSSIIYKKGQVIDFNCTLIRFQTARVEVLGDEKRGNTIYKGCYKKDSHLKICLEQEAFRY